MSILTVSREFGSGGGQIGRFVAESTGYDYVDQEGILKEIEKLGVRWQELERELEGRSLTIWQKYDWAFKAYGALIQRVILEHAIKDRQVIMGRGGNHLLGNIPHVLRIRMTAPIDARMARIMDRDSIDADNARWLIEKTDRERAGYHYALYERDWSDPSEYDFIFDSSLITMDRIKDFILDLLTEKDHLKTGESQAGLERLALAAKIKAALLTDSRIFIPTLEVHSDEDGITLRGIVRRTKELELVEKTAKTLAGNTPLDCRITFRDHHAASKAGYHPL